MLYPYTSIHAPKGYKAGSYVQESLLESLKPNLSWIIRSLITLLAYSSAFFFDLDPVHSFILLSL